MILVGGTSRIPLLRELLRTECGFDEARLNASVNADEAVARGAAVFAAVATASAAAQLDGGGHRSIFARFASN